MEVTLFIRGKKADIGVQKDFVRNFKRTLSFSDLTNPTSITTDYTYSAVLPGTPANKAIFGYPENGTQADVFNPAARYEYILNVNGVLWLHGDVKLDKITDRVGEVNFSCSFFSLVHEKIVSLGNKDLKQVSILSDSNYFRHILDRESLAAFWGGTHSFSDMIRYVPTRAGMYNDFQSDKMLYANVDSASEPPVVTYEVAELGSDYDEYATREYRIEYQRPAISLNGLIKGIVDDSSIQIDQDIMASPLIQYGWLMAPQFTTEKVEDNIYGTFDASTTGQSQISFAGMTQTSAGPTVFDSSTITPDDNAHLVTVEFMLKLRAVGGDPSITADYLYMVDDDHPVHHEMSITAKLSGGGMDITPNEGPLVIPRHVSGGVGIPWKKDGTDPRAFILRNIDSRSRFPGWSELEWTPIRFTFSLSHVHANTPFTLSLSLSGASSDFGESWPWYPDTWYTTLSRLEMTIAPLDVIGLGDLGRLKGAGWTGETLNYATSVSGWSPLYVDTNMILSKELSQRDLLTDITKSLGCVWDIQGDNIKIRTRNNYFGRYELKDWTMKLDRSSEIEYKPLAYDKAKYTLSYTDGDSLLENQYKSKTGLDYGKQYIDTGYQFNSDEEKLYTSPLYNTVMSKGDRKCVMLDSSHRGKIVTQTPYEIPMIETKDHGSPKEGYRYLMDCGWQPLIKGEFVFITQDSSWMESDKIGGRCWYDVEHYAYPAIGNNIVICSAIPLFDTRRGYASWDWAKSSVSFSGETDESYDASTALYPRFWDKYISELYSARNQVMTAWFNLTPEDLLEFSFKDFVIIDGRLWHPNKVMDFDLSGESLTKAELIEVHDIEAWTNGQNWAFSMPVGSAGRNIGDGSVNAVIPELGSNAS